jgi:hypothetical protein
MNVRVRVVAGIRGPIIMGAWCPRCRQEAMPVSLGDLPGVDPWDEARDAPVRRARIRWSRIRRAPGGRGSPASPRRASATSAATTAAASRPRCAPSGRSAACSSTRPTRRVGSFGCREADLARGWTLGLDGGASCYVEQGRYGLPVKKATWLYAYGVELPELRWGSGGLCRLIHLRASRRARKNSLVPPPRRPKHDRSTQIR